MNEFVEECRREWKRLGVPDPVANEMAAELAADLEEAEGEGASAEEVLGSGALDPRSFATAWATERGVVRRLPRGHGFPRRTRMAAAIGAFALIALIGGVLVVLASPFPAAKLTLESPVGPPPGAWVVRDAPLPVIREAPAPVPSPDGRIVAVAPPASDARVVAVDLADAGIDTRAVGWVLLIVGLAGVVPLTMFWLWMGPRRPTGSAY